MKLSDYVMNYFFEHGVRIIFGYQGSSITHLIDSLHKVNGLCYIQNYHEQASSFCADAYARASGATGVAIATSGPGATNLITGIANAYFDSIPCLFLTGQVSTHSIKQKEAIRQQGFQETDIVPIVNPITKYAVTVLEPEKIKYYLEAAYFYAKSGRPGPVLIAIPHNVQASDINVEKLHSFYDSAEYGMVEENPSLNINTVGQVAMMLAEAKRPVVLAGGGMTSIRDTKIFKTFIHACGVPVVSSLQGLDAINHDDEHFCGFIGSYGNRFANFAVAKSDLLLVLGSRLDELQTGGNRSLFAKEAQIIHVDIDPYELNHNVREDISICCDLESFLNALMMKIDKEHFDHNEWLNLIRRWKVKYPSHPTHGCENDIDPNEFMHVLSKKVAENALVCVDVGQNQMWAAQSFCLSGNKRFLSSSGHGAMGYSLPAGIGAYFASPDQQVICLMGDGGLQVNLQELQTIVRENIPVKIFVMNNKSLGMIRAYQEKCFNNRCYGSVKGFANPDFGKIAGAFGIDYTKIKTHEDFDRIDKGIETGRPHLFEVVLSSKTQVIPEPAPQRAVEDQQPLLNREDFDRLLMPSDSALKYEKI